MRRLLARYLLPQWPRVTLLGVLSTAGIGLDVLNPQVMRRFVDGALAAQALPSLLNLGALYLGIAITSQLVSVAEACVAEVAAWTATNRIRADLTAHLLRLDLAFFHEHPPGELIDRVDGDVSRLASFLSDMAVIVIGNVLLVAGIVIALFLQDWLAGLAFALFCLVTMLWLRPLVGRALPRLTARRQTEADLLGFLEERLGATEDLRANGAVAYALTGLHERQRVQFGAARRAARVTILWPASVQGLMGLGLALALALGAFLYTNHRTTLGGALVLVSYMQMLRAPLMGITAQFQEFEEAVTCVRRIAALFEERSAITDGAGDLLGTALSVEFADVSFAYGDAEEVLRSLSFRLEPGERLGVVGLTGSGKTTLTRLLFRFYDPTRGCVRLGGTDLGSLRLNALRRRIGLVTQDVQVFHATVRDNVTFFNSSIPDQRILDALRDLSLSAWLESLPDGLDTVIGTGGRGLSAGEAQLLAFTRVFLRDPGLVVLDEATSRLDPLTEGLVEATTERLLAGRTAVIIAHRLQTMSRVDRVLIMAEGRALEFGARTDLEADPASELRRLLAAGEVLT